MALKIDLSKAYDSLKWGFICDTLLGFGLPTGLINIILNCITTPFIFVLWNGEVTKSFLPSRGIRQGDPLYSYIFVLCLECLSRLIEQSVSNNHWKPVKASAHFKISHLFYADDVFLFGIANNKNFTLIMDILQSFGQESGLFMNLAKSFVIFPKN